MAETSEHRNGVVEHNVLPNEARLTEEEGSSLKARIKTHYDLCSSYYQLLWGEHIHHGYFSPSNPEQTKEEAQIALINLLLSQSSLPAGSQVLDVGCGIGGTSRFLARNHNCTVTGITISDEQVRMARKMSGGSEDSEEYILLSPESLSNEISTGNQSATVNGSSTTTASSPPSPANPNPSPQHSSGKVLFLPLDAEKMGEWFSIQTQRAANQQTHQAQQAQQAPQSTNQQNPPQTVQVSPYDAVWISEALSHFPNKQLFFHNAAKVLKNDGNGKLVIADWFRDEGLSEMQVREDIGPIEDGMLLPPLCTTSDYVNYAKEAGFEVLKGPKDISKEVAKTWDISLSLVSNPSLWALALAGGRDFIAFLRAFQAMRKGYANGSFRYAVVVFEKRGKR